MKNKYGLGGGRIIILIILGLFNTFSIVMILPLKYEVIGAFLQIPIFITIGIIWNFYNIKNKIKKYSILNLLGFLFKNANPPENYYASPITKNDNFEYNRAIANLQSAKLQGNVHTIVMAESEYQRALGKKLSGNNENTSYNNSVNNLQCANLGNINANSGNSGSKVMAEASYQRSIGDIL